MESLSKVVEIGTAKDLGLDEYKISEKLELLKNMLMEIIQIILQLLLRFFQMIFLNMF